MVTFRSVTVELRSQLSFQALPEYGSGCDNEATKLPIDYHPTNSPISPLQNISQISTFIPIYPSSQFWIYYSISPPYPPCTYFYFKLFVNGEHIVSWGCGKEEGYRGKAMYALYQDSRTRNSANSGLEKRFLFFSPAKGKASEARRGGRAAAHDRTMEIRVYRSKGRKRIDKSVEALDKAKNAASKGVDLVFGGAYEKLRPQKYYNYFLVDPVEQPFATFRFYYRTWDELCELGVVDNKPSPNIAPTIRNVEHSQAHINGEQLTVNGSKESTPSKFSENCNAWGEERTSQEFDFRFESPSTKSKGMKSSAKRLSFPPSIRLSPRGQIFRNAQAGDCRPLPATRARDEPLMSVGEDSDEDSATAELSPRPVTPPTPRVQVGKVKLPAGLLTPGKKRDTGSDMSVREEENN